MIKLADYQLRIANQWFGVSPPLEVPEAQRRTLVVGCSRSDAAYLARISGEPALLVRVRGGAEAHPVVVEFVDPIQNTLRLRLEIDARR